jgi:ribosome-associated protein
MDGNRPSKTQRKKAVHALQDLGTELVELPEEQLAAIELPDMLRDAVMEARSITAHEARRRQLQYIGKIMRKIDAEPIRAALDGWRARSDAHTAEHKRVEAWRDRLLADENALAELMAEYPRANSRQLASLLHDAKRERDAGQPPRAFRQLYQVLRQVIDGGR